MHGSAKSWSLRTASAVARTTRQGDLVCQSIWSIQAICFALIALMGSQALGQFDTVLNIPPDPDIGNGESIGSNTQVNLHDGGAIGASFDAGASDGSSTDVQVNVEGGEVGQGFQAFAGSEVNISGGMVGLGFSATDSVVNISGGSVGRLGNATSSTISVSGGMVGDSLTVSDSVVDITGGTLGGFQALNGSTIGISGGSMGGFAFSDSAVTISGDEFRLDGLSVIGVIEVPEASLLSGTLEDGTPFAFSPEDNDFSSAAATLTLQAATLPPVGPALITASTDIVPLGIRQGQTLLVDDGGGIGDNFNAGQGSTVIIETGGTVGDNLEAVDTDVMITGGTVGDFFDAFQGTTVEVSGGTVGDLLEAFAGSTINVSGGMLRGVTVHEGSEMNISGGSVATEFDDSLSVPGGTVNISGGSVLSGPGFSLSIFGGIVNLSGGLLRGGISANEGTVNITGGVTGGRLAIVDTSSVTFAGGEFYVDDSPVGVPEGEGNMLGIDLPSGSVLSGTLADGSQFIVGPEHGDFFADGVMTLVFNDVPPVGPGMITASTDDVPFGIRQGQTLLVDDGGSAPDFFNAGIGSAVIVEEGGSVGDDFDAVGAQMTVNGGSVGTRFNAYHGTVLTVTGGTMNSPILHPGSSAEISGGSIAGFGALGGSTVTVSGGSHTNLFTINGGSTATISGGSFEFLTARGIVNMSGGSVSATLLSTSNGVLNMTGGASDGGFRAERGTVNLSGGTVDGTFEAFDGGALTTEVNLYGTQFVLNGLDITDSLTPYTPSLISDRDVTLSGLLADGSPFSFDLNSEFASGEDVFELGAILHLILILPGDYNHNGVVDAADYIVWRYTLGQTGAGLAADGDGNFVVDQLDYDFWKARYGNAIDGASGGASSFAAVPEPRATTQLMLAALGLLCVMRPRLAVGLRPQWMN